MNNKQFNEFHVEIRNILRPHIDKIKSFKVTKPGLEGSRVIAKFVDGECVNIQRVDGHWVEITV